MATNDSNPKKKTTTPAKRTRRTPAEAKPRAIARKTPPQPSIARPGDDQIRLRAYELYLERGGRPGDPFEDWLRAERELVEETGLAG
jgi:hypothetical protein